jgi:hypothetical protein
MAVLKQISACATPVAPAPLPSMTVPSASATRAVGLGVFQGWDGMRQPRWAGKGHDEGARQSRCANPLPFGKCWLKRQTSRTPVRRQHHDKRIKRIQNNDLVKFRCIACLAFVLYAGKRRSLGQGLTCKEAAMRDEISQALKTALKSGERNRVATLRLVNAAINDRDIALRGKGKDPAGDEEVLDILAKMIKQREESSKLYREGGRDDLEAQELEEIAIIREFMPQQLSEAELASAIDEAVAESEAVSLRDMGKVMALIKERYRGQVDMAKAGALIKARLGG